MRYLALSLLVLAAMAIPTVVQAQAAAAGTAAAAEQRFIHHVFFWLKNPGNPADKAKLIAALEKLRAAPTIRAAQIGEPAPTRRDVIDSSYDVSWTLFFDSAADQDAYQVDPIHLKFVEENAGLWQRVVVYDTVPASAD